MMGPERNRQFEYSSLVMGSKQVPTISFSTKRVSHLVSTKTFSKKNQILNVKYSKGRSNRIRTRNQRPDIFLEGQQLCHLNFAWHREMDLKYLENYKQKLRKSTPHKSNGDMLKITLRMNGDTNCWTSFDDERPSQIVNTSSVGRRHSNSIFRNTAVRSGQTPQSTDRQRTQARDFSKGKRQLKLRMEQRIEQQRIQQKIQAKNQQIQKIGQQSKKKQLFYINQKDLSGIRTQSFIVVEYPSNQIVTGYYYRKVVEIASLTKIMTFYASLRILTQYSLDPEKEIITIDDKIIQITGTSAELYEGDTYTVMQLFYALMLPSGNDAARALAQWGGNFIGEGIKGFIAFMNKLANQIGMKFTSFGNPHGLPNPQNGSTAEDISLLICKCLQFPLFKEVIKCQKYKCKIQNHGQKRQVTWQNTNKLLRRPGFQGVKTGVTATAGPCLATLYTIANRSFIVVLLRTNKLSRRFKQTRMILSLCLRRLNDRNFIMGIRELTRNDVELDSDNSEQEQEFNFERNDAAQFQRRKRILLNQL